MQADRLQGQRLLARVVAGQQAPRPRRRRRGSRRPDADEETEKAEDKKKAPKPIVVRRLQFKRDGEGYPARHPQSRARLRRREEDERPGHVRRLRRRGAGLVAGRTMDRLLQQRTQETGRQLKTRHLRGRGQRRSAADAPRRVTSSDPAETTRPVFSPDGTLDRVQPRRRLRRTSGTRRDDMRVGARRGRRTASPDGSARSQYVGAQAVA